MDLRKTCLRLMLGLMVLAMAACTAASTGLSVGMTREQAVAALGAPDLKDSVKDPSGANDQVLRYIWLKPGKAAIFDSSNHIAVIEHVGAAQKQAAASAASQQQPAPSSFDPVETPLNYLFYPFKAGLIWVGAGINCVASGSCHKPSVPPPGSSAG